MTNAGATLIEAALRLDDAEAIYDNPNNKWDHDVWVNLETAKQNFRAAVTQYRKTPREVAHGEPVTKSH